MEPMEPREPAHTESRSEGRPWTIAAFVFAAASFFIAPILVGPIGAICGWVGYRKGDRLGLWAMWTAIGMALIGIVVATMLVTNGGGRGGY